MMVALCSSRPSNSRFWCAVLATLSMLLFAAGVAFPQDPLPLGARVDLRQRSIATFKIGVTDVGVYIDNVRLINPSKVTVFRSTSVLPSGLSADETVEQILKYHPDALLREGSIGPTEQIDFNLDGQSYVVKAISRQWNLIGSDYMTIQVLKADAARSQGN
jgi:hypothetical protein